MNTEAWVKITCAERDELVNEVYLNGRGADFCVLESCTDMSGRFHGRPRIETVWGDRKTEARIVRDVRYPDMPADSENACEHYRFEEDE